MMFFGLFGNYTGTIGASILLYVLSPWWMSWNAGWPAVLCCVGFGTVTMGILDPMVFVDIGEIIRRVVLGKVTRHRVMVRAVLFVGIIFSQPWWKTWNFPLRFSVYCLFLYTLLSLIPVNNGVYNVVRRFGIPGTLKMVFLVAADMGRTEIRRLVNQFAAWLGVPSVRRAVPEDFPNGNTRTIPVATSLDLYVISFPIGSRWYKFVTRKRMRPLPFERVYTREQQTNEEEDWLPKLEPYLGPSGNWQSAEPLTPRLLTFDEPLYFVTRDGETIVVQPDEPMPVV